MSKLTDALAQLDPLNDNHWTADGLPRLETVRLLTSDSAVTREQVNAEAADFKRPAPAAPTADVAPAAPAAPSAPDEGLRGVLGAGAPPAPAVPMLDQAGGPVPPENVLGESQPQPDPLPTAPAADGLPTANEPTAVEGAEQMSEGLTVDQVSSKQGPAGDPIPQIAEGTTTKGFNAMNSEADDIRDALATVAPSPNAPTTLGGPKSPSELDGINADGLSAAADATGEAQLRSLDRGSPGDPDALPELEAEMAKAQKHSEKLRGHADEVNEALNEASRNEARIRAAIEAATPVTGHMEAVQGYFAAQDRRAEDLVTMRQTIVDSGVDLKTLGKLVQRSGLDAAAANPAS